MAGLSLVVGRGRLGLGGDVGLHGLSLGSSHRDGGGFHFRSVEVLDVGVLQGVAVGRGRILYEVEVGAAELAHGVARGRDRFLEVVQIVGGKAHVLVGDPAAFLGGRLGEPNIALRVLVHHVQRVSGAHQALVAIGHAGLTHLQIHRTRLVVDGRVPIGVQLRHIADVARLGLVVGVLLVEADVLVGRSIPPAVVHIGAHQLAGRLVLFDDRGEGDHLVAVQHGLIVHAALAGVLDDAVVVGAGLGVG